MIDEFKNKLLVDDLKAIADNEYLMTIDGLTKPKNERGVKS